MIQTEAVVDVSRGSGGGGGVGVGGNRRKEETKTNAGLRFKALRV